MAHLFEVSVLYFQTVGKVFIISLRVRHGHGAVLAKSRLSDHWYQGEELAGFHFLDFLEDTSKIDVAENKRDN